MSCSRTAFFVLLLSGALVADDTAAAVDGPLLPPPGDLDSSAEQQEPSHTTSRSDATAPFAWSNILRDLAEDTIPRDHEVRRGWGSQTEIVSGVRVRSKNGLPRISKRTRHVNHGAWQRFRIALHRPEEKLRIAIRDVRQAEQGGMTFKVVASARVRCTGQSEFWNLGVRTGSATAQADATVRIVARFVVVGREVDPTDDGWLAEIEYVPTVDRIRIELDDFDVRRIGRLDGDLADGLGNSAQLLLAEVLRAQEPKVTRRIQRELTDRDARIKLTMPRILWESGQSMSNGE